MDATLQIWTLTCISYSFIVILKIRGQRREKYVRKLLEAEREAF